MWLSCKGVQSNGIKLSGDLLNRDPVTREFSYVN